jgi:hypothetical protein
LLALKVVIFLIWGWDKRVHRVIETVIQGEQDITDPSIVMDGDVEKSVIQDMR